MYPLHDDLDGPGLFFLGELFTRGRLDAGLGPDALRLREALGAFLVHFFVELLYLQSFRDVQADF